MRTSGDVEEPLAVAARCENRLAQALRRIGVTFGGDGGRASYADVDALGEPVVVIGPIAAKTADRLARVIEAAGNLAHTIGRTPCPDEASETAC